MPAVLNQHEITRLREFTEFIEDALGRVDGQLLWYRGCGSSSQLLTPSLYRHPKIVDAKELLALESKLITWFKHRSAPYLPRSYDDDWERLFIMQHFGIPTRLLDWTENPYIAMYFALTDAKVSYDAHGERQYLEDAALWVLNPADWNGKALQHTGFKPEILSLGDTLLGGYQPTIDPDLINSDPVAMYGTHNNLRILAQRGVFTIFGTVTDDMKQIYLSHDYPEDSLVKLIFPAARIGDLLNSLIRIGYADSVVFPDMVGLAKETKRHFGFEV